MSEKKFNIKIESNSAIIIPGDLRDYFAAQALPIIIHHDFRGSGAWDDYAQQAYEMADAMIAERNKP